MKKIVILGVIFLIIVGYIFSPYIYINDTSFIIKNENGKEIDAQIYKNYRTVDNEKTIEFILYFSKSNEPTFLTIAIPPKLIGLNDHGNGIIKISNLIFLPNKSKMFMPINEGVNKMINNSIITDSLISFTTFHDLKKFGSKIIITKNE